MKKEKAHKAKIAGGTSTTVHLEKKKRKLGPKAGSPPKQSHAKELLFGSSPLKATVDSEDVANMEASPLAALLVTSVPPSSIEPKGSAGGSEGLPSLDVRDQEAKIDEDCGGNVDIKG